MSPSDLAERVLDVVDEVPPGRATTYGLVAAAVRRATGRGAARQVGAVLASMGAAVPWWRVVRADGSLPDGLRAQAGERYRLEGTPLVADGTRVDLARALWDPTEDGDA